MPCPLALAPALARCRAGALASGLRFEPGERWHLTVRFLGPVPVELVPEVLGAARAVANTADPVLLARPRLEFQKSRGAKALAWLRFDDARGFARLAIASRHGLDSRAGLAGVLAGERRAPLAHLTVARDRALGDAAGAARIALRDAWEEARTAARFDDGECFAFEAMELWSSRLRADGPVYDRVGRFYLGALPRSDQHSDMSAERTGSASCP